MLALLVFQNCYIRNKRLLMALYVDKDIFDVDVSVATVISPASIYRILVIITSQNGICVDPPNGPLGYFKAV